MRHAGRWWMCSILIFGAAFAAETEPSEPVSALWGQRGESWNRERLPDYSYAGYRAGEVALPELPVVANVRSFGARGDGRHDETDAFRRAIAETHHGALFVPRGVYRLTSVLDIDKSHFALRGEGSGEEGTVLYFEKSMCSPTRAGFLIGRYQQIWPRAQLGPVCPIAPCRSPTSPFGRLKAAGYATRLVGKWHLPSVSSIIR